MQGHLEDHQTLLTDETGRLLKTRCLVFSDILSFGIHVLLNEQILQTGLVNLKNKFAVARTA